MTKDDSTNYTAIEPKNNHYRVPIGFFAASRARQDLIRYLHLVTHFMSFYLDEKYLENAPPVETLIENYDETNKKHLLRREISFLVNRIQSEMRRINSPIVYIRKTADGNLKEINIITEFFGLPNDERLRQYNTIVVAVYRAQGDYMSLCRRRKLDMANPLYWFSQLINIPVYILRRSGINVETEKTYKMHYWILQLLMAILLTLLIVKLGVSANVVNILRSMFL